MDVHSRSRNCEEEIAVHHKGPKSRPHGPDKSYVCTWEVTKLHWQHRGHAGQVGRGVQPTCVGEDATPPDPPMDALATDVTLQQEPSCGGAALVVIPPPPEDADDSDESMDTLSENAESLSGLSVLGAPFVMPLVSSLWNGPKSSFDRPPLEELDRLCPDDRWLDVPELNGDVVTGALLGVAPLVPVGWRLRVTVVVPPVLVVSCPA